jgi:hypothetical protein
MVPGQGSITVSVVRNDDPDSGRIIGIANFRFTAKP